MPCFHTLNNAYAISRHSIPDQALWDGNIRIIGEDVAEMRKKTIGQFTLMSCPDFTIIYLSSSICIPSSLTNTIKRGTLNSSHRDCDLRVALEIMTGTEVPVPE